MSVVSLSPVQKVLGDVADVGLNVADKRDVVVSGDRCTARGAVGV